jgi:hypothetical protein
VNVTAAPAACTRAVRAAGRRLSDIDHLSQARQAARGYRRAPCQRPQLRRPRTSHRNLTLHLTILSACRSVTRRKRPRASPPSLPNHGMPRVPLGVPPWRARCELALRANQQYPRRLGHPRNRARVWSAGTGRRPGPAGGRGRALSGDQRTTGRAWRPGQLRGLRVREPLTPRLERAVVLSCWRGKGLEEARGGAGQSPGPAVASGFKLIANLPGALMLSLRVRCARRAKETA